MARRPRIPTPKFVTPVGLAPDGKSAQLAKMPVRITRVDRTPRIVEVNVRHLDQEPRIIDVKISRDGEVA